MSEPDQRLSIISTAWTLLRSAHAGAPEEAKAARELLWLRYGGAVRRYLAAALDNSLDAEDLAQEFGMALVRGDFHRVDQSRGRFRDYVKTVLFRLVSDYRKRRCKQLPTVEDGGSILDALPAPADGSDERFRQDWREELLCRAWASLAESQPEFHLVLRFRAEHPEMSSGKMAEALADRLGRSCTAESIRQMLRRARDQFAALLFDEVLHSLQAPSPEALAEELAELNLLSYCEPLLRREALRRQR